MLSGYHLVTTPTQRTIMSSRVDSHRIAAGLETSEVAVSVTVQQEDLVRLQALATVAGVGEPTGGSFADLLSAALHRGIIERCSSAGLDLPLDAAGAEARPAAPQDDEVADSGSSRWTSTRALRRFAPIALAAATIVVIVGSYADHWTWTGFTANGQVWDWMELLVLPVAIGTFPLWLRFSGEMSARRRRALGAAVVLFIAFVVAGYLVPLTWAGFRGRTLSSWLNLLVLPITITTVAVWPKTGRRFRPEYRVAAGVLGVAWIVTVIGGYAGHWEWTGYPGNTLWDWVKLFLGPLVITMFVVPELIDLVAGHVDENGRE
jgi:uncharacterized membrane protein